MFRLHEDSNPFTSPPSFTLLSFIRLLTPFSTLPPLIHPFSEACWEMCQCIRACRSSSSSMAAYPNMDWGEAGRAVTAVNSVRKGQRTALGPDTVTRWCWWWNKNWFKNKNPLMQPSFQMIVWSEEYYRRPGRPLMLIWMTLGNVITIYFSQSSAIWCLVGWTNIQGTPTSFTGVTSRTLELPPSIFLRFQ